MLFEFNQNHQPLGNIAKIIYKLPINGEFLISLFQPLKLHE